MSIFKDCDIRGVFDKELFARDGYLVGRALATLIKGGSICVGGDVRLSTPQMKEQLIRGLAEGGCQVTDLGTIATPMMYFALHHLKTQAGAMVTASHNPAKYNGIKFMIGQEPVTRQQMDDLKAVIREEAFSQGEGKVCSRDITGEYTAFLAERFGREDKNLKVVVDAGNGAMSLIAPHVFRSCGYQAVPLFCEPDGSFPNRTPNPAEYHKLTALKEKMAEEKADLGVAFDGDGDRAVLADETGEIILSERTLALMIDYLLKDRPTPVVYDQKSSSVVKQAVLKAGGTPLPERSGHTFIKRRFLDNKAAVAGEVSGHFFFGELGYDDGLFAALLAGEIIKEKGESLHQLLKDIVCPPITPDLRIFCPYDRQDEVLSSVEKAFPGQEVSHMDGVRVELSRGWLLARKSVTAEQITLRAEGESRQALEDILSQLRKAHPLLAELGK